MSRTIGTVLVNVEANTQKLIDGFNSAEKRVDSAVSTMKKSVIGLTTAYLSFEGIVGGGKMFLQQADAMNSASSRLKLVTANSQELLNIQKQLFTVANDTRTGYIKTIDLYTNIANGAKEYGVEQSKILTTTDAINKSIIIGGASSVATEAAMEQLGQAFISNFKSVGQELGSLRDQAPRLYKAMVEGMGVTSDQFKKMAEDGKLSTEIIINAILKGTASIDKDFSQMAKTTAQGVELILNQYLKIVDGIDNKFEISSSTVASLNQITDVLSNINSYLDGLSPEQIENITTQIKNMGIVLVGSYTLIKSAQGIYSVYNSILESNAQAEIARTKIIDLETKSLKAKELAELAAMKTANSYNLITKEANYETQAQTNNTKLLQAELLKQSIVLEKNVAKQTAMNAKLVQSRVDYSLSAIGANLLKGALSTIPFMAISVGISAIATSLLTASDNSEILGKTIKSTGEELSKLTQNQLKYRKSLVETELIQARLDLSNAKAKAANGTLADKSYADEMSIKFEELTKSSRNVKQALKDLSNAKTDLDSKSNNNPTPIVRDDSAVIKIMGSEFSKFNLELDENIKKLKNSGATQAEVDKYRADSIKNFNEKQQKDSKKTNDELIKQAEETSKAYSETAQIGMSDYNKSLISIADKVGAWTKAGVDNIEILRVQGILLDELNQKQALETTKTDLSYYERKLQLQTESYEKELELQGISYGQKVLEIEGSSGESAEKERLIELEAELYNATVARMELERNTEFQETISGFYDDMLESQLELNSALYDFGDGFGEVGNKIASVSKSLATMTNADLKSKKELSKLNDKYAKEFKRYAKDETKTKKLLIAYEEEEQQLKQQTLMNQIGGLSEFAGQSKQFFSEQTGAYKVLNALEAVGHAARMTAMAAELPGQITSLSVNIANALAGQGSIPIVGFALVAGMAALLAGLGVMSAGGGGGGGASSGGGSKKPSQFDIREQELEDLYTPMTDRLDRQIELLESIDKQGSASALSLTAAKISFERDYQLAVNNINKTLPTDVRGYGLDFNQKLSGAEKRLGFNIADVYKIYKSGWDKSEKRIYTDFSSLSSGFNMLKVIADYFETKDTAVAAWFGGSNKLNLAANQIQKVIGDFTSGIVDSLDDMKSASSEFKDIYDSMTGTMYYENKRLVQAFNEVEILTKNGDLATYLKNNIDEIDNLQEIFTNSVMSTLLSQDPKDMAKQIVVLEQLQTKTGLVFENGARDALDFMESITLVSEAMVGSRENISTFINDFKSEDLIALDLSNKLGTNLALNYDDLALKFKEMASDIYGLTDAELEFLEANKSYIERIQDAKKQALEDELELTKSSVSTIQSMSNSLDSVITKLRGNLSTTAATSIAKFNESMSSTLLLSNGNDYKALEDSLKNTISYSDALNNADYFNSSRDMQFAQAIAANQFESMDVKLEDELSVLQQISANTSAMIEALENSASFDIYAQNLETSVKIKAFANGGIVTSPTFGLIGEAGYSEAVIPLKNPNDPLGQKELIAEIRALRKEVADLNNSSSKTAENTTPSRYVS